MSLAAPVHPTLFWIHLPAVYAANLHSFLWDCTNRTGLDADLALVAKILKAKIYRFVYDHGHVRCHCCWSEIIAELLGDHMSHSSLFPHAGIDEGRNHRVG